MKFYVPKSFTTIRGLAEFEPQIKSVCIVISAFMSLIIVVILGVSYICE